MVRHLFNLQSDPPNSSSTPLAPYIVITILGTQIFKEESQKVIFSLKNEKTEDQEMGV